MRKTTDLFELDFVFSQQSLLTPEEFIREYKRRESYSSHALGVKEQLEALHEARVLMPMYRFVKNIDPILKEARRRRITQTSVITHTLGDQTALSHYLHGYTEIGNPIDPREESFTPWLEYETRLRGHFIRTSTFYYSPYQILLFPILQKLVPKMGTHKTPQHASTLGISYTLDPKTIGGRSHYQRSTLENDELIITLTALESRYRPMITGRLTNRRGYELDSWFDYQRDFDALRMLHWLSWNAERILATAETLLFTADTIDPLSDWSRLVRLCNFEKLEGLRGDALLAVDHRVAAEMLLLFYEDLQAKGEAPPLQPVPKRFYAARRNRLKTDRTELSDVLMDFGISPQPSLILVLEGETELLLVPRVFALLGIPLRQDHITVFNAGGIDRDFGLLAKYVVTPEIGEAISKGYLLTRPPTRYLVVVDPERSFVTPKMREEKRKAWVLDIWNSISKNERRHIPISEINELVQVRTWNRKGESFEFAHFTNRQLATAILEVYKGPSGPPFTDLEAQIGTIRKHAGNLAAIWKRWKGIKPSKVRLADSLWPELMDRIEVGLSRDTHSRLPVVRIAIHADRLARQTHRHRVMIRSKERSI